MEENNWVRIIISSDSDFFPIFQNVIKQVEFGKEFVLVNVINKERSVNLKKECKDQFKFVFDWQNKDTCGIEVFKKIGEF